MKWLGTRAVIELGVAGQSDPKGSGLLVLHVGTPESGITSAGYNTKRSKRTPQ